MVARSNLRQAVDDGALLNGKVASHADRETAMQAGLNILASRAESDRHDTHRHG
jgi:hypothetical protein